MCSSDLGWVLVSLGHVGDWSGLGAEQLRALLDASLAPLRNTHKFDVVLRLPIAMGAGFAAAAVLGSPRAWLRRAGAALLALLLAGTAWPALAGTLTRDRSFESVPEYWSDAAAWLRDASPSGRALVVPGASFGIYAWGRTQDEPLQAIDEVPWAVRDAVPLSSAGNIRWLDAVESRLETGQGSPGLADALARDGVRWIVGRNDIDRRRTDAPRAEIGRAHV